MPPRDPAVGVGVGAAIPSVGAAVTTGAATVGARVGAEVGVAVGDEVMNRGPDGVGEVVAPPLKLAWQGMSEMPQPISSER